MNQNEEIKDSGNLFVFIALSCLILILTISMTLFIGQYAENERRGTFGDMFGFANALFTGLSCIGLIITILLQRKDLNIQRNELQKQTKSIHIQNFENTFFQMLTLFHNIVDTTEFTLEGQKYKSRSAFHRIVEALNKSYSDLARDSDEWHFEDNQYEYLESENVILEYNRTYQLYKEYLSHYYRTYYHIIRFIHITDDIDKRFYISIARAQLSDHETVLFFYNGLHENGVSKFKPLIEQYTVFNNIDKNLLVNLKIMNEYSKTAFNYKEELIKTAS